jgi:GTP-binding protein HflX
VVAEVDASAIEELIVFNKADLVSEEEHIRLRGICPGAFLVSARTGMGIAELEAAIASSLPLPEVLFEGLIPYDRGDLVSKIHMAGKVQTIEYVEGGTKIKALVREDLAAELSRLTKRP